MTTRYVAARLAALALLLFLPLQAFSYYNASTGRWLSRDPISEKGGRNVYAFVANQPAGRIDLLGLFGNPVVGKSGQTCHQCCCCAESVTLGDVQQFFDSSNYGYSFKVDIVLSYQPYAPRPSSCTLKWIEKSNIPYYPSVNPKYPTQSGTDMAATAPSSPTFASWNARTQPCPGSEPITIIDTPGLPTGNGFTGTYNLDFEITVESGSGCLCASSSKTVRARMTLLALAGGPLWSISQFTVGY
jgi:hypothetical protein